eukprot:52687_1
MNIIDLIKRCAGLSSTDNIQDAKIMRKKMDRIDNIDQIYTQPVDRELKCIDLDHTNYKTIETIDSKANVIFYEDSFEHKSYIITLKQDNSIHAVGAIGLYDTMNDNWTYFSYPKNTKSLIDNLGSQPLFDEQNEILYIFYKDKNDDIFTGTFSLKTKNWRKSVPISKNSKMFRNNKSAYIISSCLYTFESYYGPRHLDKYDLNTGESMKLNADSECLDVMNDNQGMGNMVYCSIQNRLMLFKIGQRVLFYDLNNDNQTWSVCKSKVPIYAPQQYLKPIYAFSSLVILFNFYTKKNIYEWKKNGEDIIIFDLWDNTFYKSQKNLPVSNTLAQYSSVRVIPTVKNLVKDNEDFIWFDGCKFSLLDVIPTELIEKYKILQPLLISGYLRRFQTEYS